MRKYRKETDGNDRSICLFFSTFWNDLQYIFEGEMITKSFKSLKDLNL